MAETTGVSVRTIERYLALLRLPEALQAELGTTAGSAGVGAMAAIAKAFAEPADMVEAYNQVSGFAQPIQAEILKRADGKVEALPDLVLAAQEGAFNARRCGTGIADCPHIPEPLRQPLLDAARAMKAGIPDPAQSLRAFAARHKKTRQRP